MMQPLFAKQGQLDAMVQVSDLSLEKPSTRPVGHSKVHSLSASLMKLMKTGKPSAGRTLLCGPKPGRAFQHMTTHVRVKKNEVAFSPRKSDARMQLIRNLCSPAVAKGPRHRSKFSTLLSPPSSSRNPSQEQFSAWNFCFLSCSSRRVALASSVQSARLFPKLQFKAAGRQRRVMQSSCLASGSDAEEKRPPLSPSSERLQRTEPDWDCCTSPVGSMLTEPKPPHETVTANEKYKTTFVGSRQKRRKQRRLLLSDIVPKGILQPLPDSNYKYKDNAAASIRMRRKTIVPRSPTRLPKNKYQSPKLVKRIVRLGAGIENLKHIAEIISVVQPE